MSPTGSQPGGERVLVNFFYAPPVGHAIEALHYCLGHHVADPSREIAVALPGAARLLPRQRRATARRARAHHGGGRSARLRPHQHLRLDLPETARTAAATRWAGQDAGSRTGGRIALMPAGSGPAALYPSRTSWLAVLSALADAFPQARVALVGKRTRDERTATSFGEADVAALLAHPSRPMDCFDLALAEQLAVVESCDLFPSPHTGFGLAALAVDTPWLTLSGGRWFEYFFNHVPFRSVLPDTERYPSFSQFAPAAIVDDEGPRTPSMSRERIDRDLPRIVAAAGELLAGSLSYEQALRDYFPALLAAHQGDLSQIWSIDGIHLRFLWRPPGA